MADAIVTPCTVESAPRASRDTDEFVMPSLISLWWQPGF